MLKKEKNLDCSNKSFLFQFLSFERFEKEEVWQNEEIFFFLLTPSPKQINSHVTIRAKRKRKIKENQLARISTLNELKLLAF